MVGSELCAPQWFTPNAESLSSRRFCLRGRKSVTGQRVCDFRHIRICLCEMSLVRFESSGSEPNCYQLRSHPEPNSPELSLSLG